MHDFDGERENALAPAARGRSGSRSHNVIAIVGDTVFSHAGVLPTWATRSTRSTSTRAAGSTARRGTEPPPALDQRREPGVDARVGRRCGRLRELDGVLAKLGAKRMVVGHTVQQNGITRSATASCGGSTSGSSKVYDGPIQALELAADAAARCSPARATGLHHRSRRLVVHLVRCRSALVGSAFVGAATVGAELTLRSVASSPSA